MGLGPAICLDVPFIIRLLNIAFQIFHIHVRDDRVQRWR